MLPKSAGHNQLSEAAYRKLQVYYQQFCGGSNRNYYGLGHMMFACHAAFPLLLSPHLANIIWLNFKNYNSNGVTRTIAPEAVSDFLLSTVCRQVAHQQYEVDPEIRGYLLYHLKNNNWFGLYGIQNFGEERLSSVADCVFRYFNEPLLQQYTSQKGFKEVNEWAVLAYRNPQALAYKVAQSLKAQIDSANTPGQLRINMLMEKLNHQYDMSIHAGNEKNTGSFINLYRYSKARKAVLFNEEPDMVFQMMDEIDDGLTSSSIANAIELPVEKNIQERVKRKSHDIQKVHALMVGIDVYAETEYHPLKGCVQSVAIFQKLFEEISGEAKLVVNTQMLTNESATRENILHQLKELFEKASPQDIVLFFFSGHGRNSDMNENQLISYDAAASFSQQKSLNESNIVRATPISNHFFREELKKWQAIKNCQTILILDTHTGYYDWVNEDDIFIGAVTHSQQSEFQKDSVSTSAFFHAFKNILTNVNGKITYEDLFSATRFKMKYDYPEIEETEIPILMCSKQNRTKYFLRKNDINAVFYYQSAFKPNLSLWEIMTKDFLPLKEGAPVDFFLDVYQNAIEKRRGEIVLEYGDKFYYYFTNNSFPQLDGSKINKVQPVLPPMVFELKYDTNELTEEFVEEITELLERIEFDEFCYWHYMRRNISPDATRDNPDPSVIPIIIHLSKKGNAILYRIEADIDGLEIVNRFVIESSDPTRLETIFKRIARYEYFLDLKLPNEGVVDRINVGLNVVWALKSGAGRRVNSPSELSVDGRFIEVVDGEIKFPPVVIEIMNREEFPVFIDVYLLLSDGSISRMATLSKLIGQASKSYKAEPVRIDINASDMMIQMYAQGLAAQCKLLISRTPIHIDFSQPAII